MQTVLWKSSHTYSIKPAGNSCAQESGILSNCSQLEHTEGNVKEKVPK